MTSPDDGVPPEPSTSAVIKGGAVAGVLPEAEAFAVHYPGYPSSPDRAVETLGGLPEIAKARSSETGILNLRFRPEDPYCHPVSGELRPCAGLLLRISKTKPATAPAAALSSSSSETGQLSAEVVARVSQAYHFEGMADYQHVLAVHAAEASRRKRHRASDSEQDSGKEDNLEPDPEDVLMLVPELFSHKNVPENLVLNPSVNLFSKNIQKGVVEHRWEMDIEPCHAIAFDIERIPVKINWEDKLQRETDEWEWQMAVSKLFEERPIWPRWSLFERLLDDGVQVTENMMKRLLLRSGYYFSTGPYGRFWIIKGYDPRKDPESRIYQKVDFRMPPQLRITNAKSKQTWKEISRFQVFPSKNFVCLQFFELDDDFIQGEIRKPTKQKTCSHATGWFSRALLKTLRLRVSVRFLSIFPKRGAEDLLKSKCDFFERSKKMEAISRFQEPEKEHQHVGRDSNISAEVPCAESNGSEHEREPNNGEIEDEDEEDDEEDEEDEEEEEMNGYESLPVAGEDDTFALDAGSYKTGESIPSNLLQELLSGFPFSKDGKDSPRKDGCQGADSSDSEYQILEQESDDDDDY